MPKSRPRCSAWGRTSRIKQRPCHRPFNAKTRTMSDIGMSRQSTGNEKSRRVFELSQAGLLPFQRPEYSASYPVSKRDLLSADEDLAGIVPRFNKKLHALELNPFSQNHRRLRTDISGVPLFGLRKCIHIENLGSGLR